MVFLNSKNKMKCFKNYSLQVRNAAFHTKFTHKKNNGILKTSQVNVIS